MAFSVYALPAMIALATKLGLLAYDRLARMRTLQSRLFLLLLFGLGIQNLAETAFLSARARGVVDHVAGTWWLSAAILVTALLLHLALVSALTPRADDRPGLPSWVPALLYVPAALLQLLLWRTPLLIVGFEPMSYTITKVPGPLYFVLEIYLVGYLGAAVALLAYGATRHALNRRKLQNRLLLLGFVPPVALALIVIGLQRFGFQGFNASVTLPLTSTVLLLLVAYALYRQRLIDPAFYIPWSACRRHRTALYRRIQEVTADLPALDSPREILQRLAEALGCRVALFGGPHPWLVAPRSRAGDGDAWHVADFPGASLKGIDRILTVDELTDRDPELHALMKRYKVGAIVPLHPRGSTHAYSLLLDQRFNQEIYSSLDFKMVEQLFGATAQRFFEDFLLVRSQLEYVKEELRDATRNLVRTEQSLAGVKHELRATRRQNEQLREEVARLRRAGFRVVSPPPAADDAADSLGAFLAEREQDAVLAALARAEGNRLEAARLLGIAPEALERLIERHRLDPDGLPG
jgi:hypothetical protein